LTITIARTAWIGDDALITLRHILNATHGWGPSFNVTESVLGATHPLWMLLWMGAGSITDSWILSNFIMSICFSVFAAALILWSAQSVSVVIGASLALMLWSAYIDYSTSGLENPLAMALVGLLILQSRAQRNLTPLLAMVLGLSAAAVILTRADLLLIVLPALLHVLLRWRRRIDLVLIGLASSLVPLAVWSAWSWSTFSSLVPNTFAAKSNVAVPRAELLAQGMRYLQVTLGHDWGTALVLIFGGAVVAALGSRWSRLWLLGVFNYLLYVVWVGGDFMAGRFLAIPLYVVVFLVTLLSSRLRFFGHASAQRKGVWGGAVLLIVVTIAAAAPTPTALTRDPGERWDESFGIVDERGFYANWGRTLHVFILEDGDGPPFQFRSIADSNPGVGSLAEFDSAARSWPERENLQEELPSDVGLVCWLGATAVLSGPTVHWIDTCALTDRFLAGITFTETDWRIGHFERDIPQGYLEAIRANDAEQVEDPELRRELKHLWSRIR